ncbi:uncharacterized protein LOC116197556 [Punica granatum]|nr:uncharacterized protein LOC116197556 [Punica granatum]OWM70232.1 hypothetical protein CDL15_Pgr026082 [Punica granatum]
MSHFLSYCAGIARGGSVEELPHPDFGTASSLFPPRDPLPKNFLKVMERGWFKEGKFAIHRFVFDHKSISILRERAREGGLTPTRHEVVSGVIWKHATAASREKSGSPPRISISIHSTDMRQRMKEKIPKCAVGNLLWSAFATYDPSNGTSGTLPHLVRLVRESVGKTNGDYLRGLAGDGGSELFTVD